MLPLVNSKNNGNKSYTVGSEDILAIDVYDNPDLKGEYTVSTDGYIVFPLVGQVNVSEKTLVAIKDKLTKILEKDYLYNPIVSVDVSKYLSKKVKIMGNVGKPGIYFLDSPTRLFDLLTKAEGVSSQLGTVMSGQKAHIMRDSSQGTNRRTSKNIRTYYVDLHQLLVEGKDEANVYLQDGDVIYIPDNSSFHVIGEVKHAGTFPFEEGITLLKAITLADGVTEKGSVENAVIKRMQNGRVVEVKVSLDSLLQIDDTVYIPEDTNFIHVVGEVKAPDSFPYKHGISLLKAITMAGGATTKGSIANAVIKRQMSNGRVAEIKASIDTVLQPDDTVFVPEIRSYHVVGEVKQPGSFPYEQQVTLLTAIAMAGGATKKAAPKNTVIKRLKNGKVEEIEASMDTLIMPDDVVDVPLSFW